MSLQRFHEAQERDYGRALKELKQGRKESHWMWYIFPQFRGLGFSSTARYYEIQSVEEGLLYTKDPILYPHLLEISSALLETESSDPAFVMGYPDDLKLQSSMTLFYLLTKEPLFLSILEKFHHGVFCSYTVQEMKKEGITL